MTLLLGHCNDEDMSRAFEIISTAFGHEHPYIEFVYPLHDTPTGRANGAERLLATKRADPHTTFLKATDTGTGKIIGVAKWNVYNGVIPEEVRKLDGDYWSTEDERELAEWYMNDYLQLRRKAITDSGGDLVSLDLMCIDPDHQRQGAGTLLMQWGIEMADKLDTKAVVESTTYGTRLYENFGFSLEQHVTMEPPAKWALEDGSRTQKFLWMTRPAKNTIAAA